MTERGKEVGSKVKEGKIKYKVTLRKAMKNNHNNLACGEITFNNKLNILLRLLLAILGKSWDINNMNK